MGAGDIHRVAETIAEDLRHLEELRLLVGRDSILRPYEPMRKHTSLRVGGPAQFWFEPVSEMALARMLQACDPRGLSITMIGRGTNLLVKDSGIKGVCVHLGQPAFSDISINGTQIRAGAGARLKDVVYQAKKAGLGGLEFMEGIPGNLGGALRMNAGAMQSWVMEVTDSVRYMDLKGAIRESRVSDMEVQYRNVPLLENHIALSAVLRGIPRKEAEISEVLKGYSKKRWSSQPAAPSAGCTFKNSGPIPSGKLIEELGLKDMTSGAARISPVHANFIVNEGGATAQDVLGLVDLIRSKALAERGITLELEVKILGD
jgi:UDP-N-acetylmuramate--alanine ligase